MKGHWLETVVTLLKAETNDLRELARIAGYDPRTFYRDVLLRNLEAIGQDLEGMQFAEGVYGAVAEYEIRELKFLTILSAFGNPFAFNYAPIQLRRIMFSAGDCPVFGQIGIVVPIDKLDQVANQVRIAAERLGLKRRIAVHFDKTIRAENDGRTASLFEEIKKLLDVLERADGRIAFYGIKKTQSPRSHSNAAVMQYVSNKMLAILRSHFRRIDAGSFLAPPKGSHLDAWRSFETEVFLVKSPTNSPPIPELRQLADLIARIVFQLSLSDDSIRGLARTYAAEFGYRVRELGVAESTIPQ